MYTNMLVYKLINVFFRQGLLYHRTCKPDFRSVQLAFAKFLSKIKDFLGNTVSMILALY